MLEGGPRFTLHPSLVVVPFPAPCGHPSLPRAPTSPPYGENSYVDMVVEQLTNIASSLVTPLSKVGGLAPCQCTARQRPN